MARITIKDVARKLNFSISTISRAFNDKYDIHPDTKALILQTAKEMGYTPNPLAQRLINKKSYQIGVIVPEFENAFFPKIILGIQHVMSEAGYQVLIMSSNEDKDQELANVRALQRNMVDGIILSLTNETKDISYLKELIDSGIPLVQFNRVSYKLNTSKILFDDYTWAMKATEHLIEQGFKRIMHLAGPHNMIISQLRKKGFLDAMKKHGLPHGPEAIREGGIFMEDGTAAAEKLWQQENLPEAIFCFNDPVAIGAMEFLKEKGIRIPEEVAFVGFSESRLASHITPTLTSVEQPTYQYGETAARLMLDQLSYNNFEPQTVTLNGKMNVRESSVLSPL